MPAGFWQYWPLLLHLETNKVNIMEITKFDDTLINSMLEEQAWKDLSGSFAWTEELLEKYRGKLDWERVTANNEIHWTPSMLEKFRYSIDWKEMSRTSISTLLLPEVVERFKDRWDWKELSANGALPFETIERMADRIDWGVLVNSGRYLDSPYTRAFLEKWADRIPADSLLDSNLWYDLVGEKAREIERRIMADQCQNLAAK